ncbi:MAG: hypothetical protein QOH67_2845 [Hyphomicrobiales bacterium]|jgi:hypothetical protein|nr:hypothetical protein [Hyphomicrobiales bacterium]
MPSDSQRVLRCPSAQPGMADLQVLGVLSPDVEPRVAYLEQAMPATADVLKLAEPVPPMEVFRLSARCEEKRCIHFDGSLCQLAVRIVHMLPEVTGDLPACTIRADCRWFRQEGRAACRRCPQVLTLDNDSDDLRKQVAGTHFPSA